MKTFTIRFFLDDETILEYYNIKALDIWRAEKQAFNRFKNSKDDASIIKVISFENRG